MLPVVLSVANRDGLHLEINVRPRQAGPFLLAQTGENQQSAQVLDRSPVLAVIVAWRKHFEVALQLFLLDVARPSLDPVPLLELGENLTRVRRKQRGTFVMGVLPHRPVKQRAKEPKNLVC